MGQGDLVHLETPLNPSGTASDISAFAAAAHARGALLSVDATFAPPPLQDPFACGADYVLHSGTKYLGGHSDMLCGVLAVGTQRRSREEWEGAYWELVRERVFLGAVMGSLEGWLGVRSVRTLELRVVRQSRSAEAVVAWMESLLRGEGDGADGRGEIGLVVRSCVAELQHASLQKDDIDNGNGWLAKQMPRGYGPVFGLMMKDSELAKRLPSKLRCFHHATSLGGVESLIEWRRMSDESVDERLLRVSIGVEDVEDLKEDFVQGFRALIEERNKV